MEIVEDDNTVEDQNQETRNMINELALHNEATSIALRMEEAICSQKDSLEKRRKDVQELKGLLGITPKISMN